MLVAFSLFAAVVAVFALTVIFGAPYLPSHRRDVKRVFDDLRPLSKSDTLLDFGGGDGLVCLEASSRGARSINFEINPFLVIVSKIRLRRYKDLYRGALVNYLQVDIPKDVTIIYIFSESRHISGIYRKIQKEATRQGKSYDVISYGFEFPGVNYINRNDTHFLYRVESLHT